MWGGVAARLLRSSKNVIPSVSEESRSNVRDFLLALEMTAYAFAFDRLHGSRLTAPFNIPLQVIAHWVFHGNADAVGR
jgi:hypothetical protein